MGNRPAAAPSHARPDQPETMSAFPLLHNPVGHDHCHCCFQDFTELFYGSKTASRDRFMVPDFVDFPIKSKSRKFTL